MSLGTGIALFVIGAILTFALNFEVDFIDLDLVGYILMGAGVVMFVVGLALLLRRRSSTTTSRTGYDADGGRVTRRSTDRDAY